MTTLPPINILILGGTGFCGRALVQQALQQRKEDCHATVLVRDAERAAKMFAKQGNSTTSTSTETSSLHIVVGTIPTESSCSAAASSLSDDFTTAVQAADVIINCVSSYQPPHTQVSTILQQVLNILYSTTTMHRRRLLVHFGYPRGLGPHGTRLERWILQLTEMVSTRKYGPAIRDHKRALEILSKASHNHNNTIPDIHLEYTLFAAPKMVERRQETASPPLKQRQYQGGPKDGSLDLALQKSRVWHSVDTMDAAQLILDHVLESFVRNSQLPPWLCLNYYIS